MATPAPPPIDALAGVREIVAVHSAKGGVGKSTVAANLAVTLARRGLAVGLLDADMWGPSVAHMFGDSSMPAPSPRGGLVLPLERHGVKFLSIANAAGDSAPIIWRGPMVSQAIAEFLSGIDWGTLDVLFVDMPPGTGDALLGIGQSVTLSGVVTVTTPSALSLSDTIRGMQGFGQLSVPLLGLVENLAELVCDGCGDRVALFGKGEGEAAAAELGVPFLGRLPIDPAVVVGGDSGVPIVASDPDGETARAYGELADGLTAQLAVHGRAATGTFEIPWQNLRADVFRAEPQSEPADVGDDTRPDLPVAIWQAGDRILGIRWADGETTFHGAYELRLACPCAGCVEEWSGEKLPSLDQVPADVRPVHIATVGRYALQPRWSDGHDTGIYSFRDLRDGAGRIEPN
jgi:ATP-binding protein involved in chromosome partitioning